MGRCRCRAGGLARLSACVRPGPAWPDGRPAAAGLWLTWNGEIFEAEDPALVDQALNDTQQLFDRWSGASFSEALLVHTLAHMDGPYAFVLLDVRGSANAASE